MKGEGGEEELTAEEGYQLLAAFLALPRSDQVAFLAKDHEQMSSGLQELVPRKRKDVEHVKSPKHKRAKQTPRSPSQSSAESPLSSATESSGSYSSFHP